MFYLVFKLFFSSDKTCTTQANSCAIIKYACMRLGGGHRAFTPGFLFWRNAE